MASFGEIFREYYWVGILLVVLVVIGVIVVWIIYRCRRKSRYEYTSLEDEDRLEMDQKRQREVNRNLALINCEYYLRGSSRYVFQHHLNDIGSRLEKHWFLVQDTTTKTERLLTMAPVNANCLVNCNAATQWALLEIFLAFQHPYVYPILDITFITLADQQYVVTVMPFNEKGSLKDLLYHSHCQDNWSEKYNTSGHGLDELQVKQLGRQILEGIMFLEDQGFPPFDHLHSANVIIQNGVARIVGLEGTLLGVTPKIYPVIKKCLRHSWESIIPITFGHLLFEMTSGYTLSTAHPSVKHYSDISSFPEVVKVLKFIFEQEQYRYPSIQEISCLDFFRNIDLRELKSQHVLKKLSPTARRLLKENRRCHRSLRHTKKSRSTSSLEKAASNSGERLKSRGSKVHVKIPVSGTLPTVYDISGPTVKTVMSHSQPTVSSPLSPVVPKPGAEARRLEFQKSKSGGSSLTMASFSTSGSVDYFTPPTTPQASTSEDTSPFFPTSIHIHSQLLAEITQKSKLRKSLSDERPSDA
ncbi:slowpoke binding protein isoform X2 [Tachypleus tridentatus]|uniref:slowpoke binding protein isoform X2 n=1 Tax=Tachypleus tridentatus TaxID=6853 RepID=UPI003FCF3002